MDLEDYENKIGEIWLNGLLENIKHYLSIID